MEWLTLMANAQAGRRRTQRRPAVRRPVGPGDRRHDGRTRLAGATQRGHPYPDRCRAGGAVVARTVNAGIRELRLDLQVDGDMAQRRLPLGQRARRQCTGQVQHPADTHRPGLGLDTRQPLERQSARPACRRSASGRCWRRPAGGCAARWTPTWPCPAPSAAPQWSGKLRADELALRSVVEGIEFGNGQLRATLQGQRLNIDSFSLQGAGGAAGGELNATGFASWTVATGATPTPHWARSNLQLDAVAKSLRVSAAGGPAAGGFRHIAGAAGAIQDAHPGRADGRPGACSSCPTKPRRAWATTS